MNTSNNNFKKIIIWGALIIGITILIIFFIYKKNLPKTSVPQQALEVLEKTGVPNTKTIEERAQLLTELHKDLSSIKKPTPTQIQKMKADQLKKLNTLNNL